MTMRIVFMGTPDFSVPTLAELAEAGHDVAAVYTQPPRPAGRRGLEPTPSPVQREAERRGFAVRSEAELAAFRALGADVAVVVAYGLILPEAFLQATPHGALNGHASLLPRWRGAAPVQRAIMAGDRETGVMIMRMEKGLDTGPVGLSRAVAIGADETAGALHDRLSRVTAALMVEALAALEAGMLRFTPQPTEGVTYAAKIDKAETRIGWNADAKKVHDRIRGLSPFPGAWCEMELAGRPERVKILESGIACGSGRPGEVLEDGLTVACGSGALRLMRLQRAGGRPVTADEFLRGASVSKGSILS
jgi:methionyl-tRNA formyltransferase